jgi:hypothetical protein
LVLLTFKQQLIENKECKMAATVAATTATATAATLAMATAKLSARPTLMANLVRSNQLER